MKPETRAPLTFGGGLLLLLLLLAAALQPVPDPTSATDTQAAYDPAMEALLLHNGYSANIIQVGPSARGLRASQRNYTNSVWARDLDYAISGYSYALDDMSVFREYIGLFLERVEPGGVVPETIYLRGERLEAENRQSWDSMPNLIHATYVYVSKTGDGAFYNEHRQTLLAIGGWIARQDTSGDGLPDMADFPFGYYDSVRNGVMHTYAIARFYGAYRNLAALERFSGNDGSVWDERAARMRSSFHLPAGDGTSGGYWLPGQAWPLAWKRPAAPPISVLETPGVFAALHTGLIGPQDGERYSRLMSELRRLRPELVRGPSPLRLALGGYPPDVRRPVDPPVPLWMLDASAPWVVGIAAPAYAAAGAPGDAWQLLDSYTRMAQTTDPPVLEFAAGEGACFGAGNSGDGGRTWDSAAWFLAVYGGHYGLTMTPERLVIQPRPFAAIAGDGIVNLHYQGAVIQMQLDSSTGSYRLQTSQPVRVLLRPVGTAPRLRVNGNDPVREGALTLHPATVTVFEVVSEGATAPPPTPDPLPAGGLYDCRAFRQTWQRTDLPVAEQVGGLQPRAWVWGPAPRTGGLREAYAEGVNGTRLVQYYDKSRMEINDPTQPGQAGYVTNGLLVSEMIQGRVQVGNESFRPATPAEQPVAGDPAPVNPLAPTYRSFGGVAYPTSSEPAPNRVGDLVMATLAKDGTTGNDPALAGYNVRIGSYEPQLGHNIPQVFVDFFGQRGLVYADGQYTSGQIIDAAFVVGLPISEPYWARVRVGGVERDVLMQAFERRVLTYTPDNAPAWRVEMGNVGQHYLRWRYGE